MRGGRAGGKRFKKTDPVHALFMVEEMEVLVRGARGRRSADGRADRAWYMGGVA